MQNPHNCGMSGCQIYPIRITPLFSWLSPCIRRRRWVLVFLVFTFCVRKLFDDLSPTTRSSPHINRKRVRTNSPETKSNKKGLEERQNKIDEKGQSIIRNIALKNWATVVNVSLCHNLFALEFKDVLAREVAKECKD